MYIFITNNNNKMFLIEAYNIDYAKKARGRTLFRFSYLILRFVINEINYLLSLKIT